LYADTIFSFDQNKNKMSKETKTLDEETKTVETKEELQVESEKETQPVSLQEFLNKSFECLFNQNVHLHRALAQVLQEEFKKQEDRKLELEEKIDALEKNIKEGFLHYTREIMKGLDDANQALMDTILDTIAPPLEHIPPPQLARRSSPISVLEV
jgi:ABC-type hemin transport system ATPase subunit